MEESLFYASQELKRAEHLLYVSLKYTRTGDVIKSLVSRLIACFDCVINGLVKKSDIDSTTEASGSPFNKVNILKNMYKDNKAMCDYLDFYLLLRKISRSDGFSENEFRRNLVLKTKVDDKQIEITIDISGDYYHKTVEFLNLIKGMHILER